MGNWFARLQSVGKELMLPVAVLPAAALLLRFGAPDAFDIPFMEKEGVVVFGNLALLFAIGISVGLAKDNNGASGYVCNACSCSCDLSCSKARKSQ